MLLSRLLEVLEEKKVTGFREIEVGGLSCDSRLVEPGQAFFCIKGLVTDGHLYAAQAVRQGAAVLVVEKDVDLDDGEAVLVRVPDSRLALALCSAEFYGNPSASLKLVGVTGTNGKTTTTFLVESIMKEAGRRTGLIGTVENHVAGSVEPVVRTTPESLDLQRLLARMVEEKVEVVALEVSSHALELHRAGGCLFDVVVFMNLTQDHLDFHITLEEYFGAKRKLFEGEQFGPDRIAVVNADDEFGRRLLEETTLDWRSFAVEEEDASTRALSVEVSDRGNSFLIQMGGRRIEVQTILQGGFNVYNCLAAATAAALLGAADTDIKAGLERLEGVPGRFERIDCGQDFTVIVDYAHTPDGVRNLLEACREVSPGRVIVVVGCGGDRDRSKRPLMARAAVELSDLCVITSDNPRSEDPASIIEMMVDGVRGRFSEERYVVEVDRQKAIYRALELAKPTDLVVVAGKGHESGQTFADRVVPFDDRDVARLGLKEVRGAPC